MHSSIIFCLVFTLISSKLENNHYKTLLKITKDILTDDSDDSEICEEQETQKTCTAQKLIEPDMECCFLSAEIKYNDQEPVPQEMCQSLPKGLGEIKDIINLKQTKELIKELYGFVLVNLNQTEMPDDFSVKLKMKCNDADIKTDFSFSLTDDDRDKLSSENHCFYPIYNATFDKNPPFIDDSVKCEKFFMRKDSLNAGLECGYIMAQATMENDTQSIKTCFPFNYDLLNKVTKLKLIQKLKEYIMDEDVEFDNLHIEFYNSKGKKVIFDTNDTDTNNSMILKSSLLLLFILFMF